MPSNAPMAAIKKAAAIRVVSLVRHWRFLAFCLSIPYIAKVNKFHTARAIIRMYVGIIVFLLLARLLLVYICRRPPWLLLDHFGRSFVTGIVELVQMMGNSEPLYREP